MNIVVAKIGFDAAENEPSKVCCKGFTRYFYNALIPHLHPRPGMPPGMPPGIPAGKTPGLAPGMPAGMQVFAFDKFEIPSFGWIEVNRETCGCGRG